MPMVSLLISVSTEDLEPAERDEQATDLGRRLRELDDAALSTIASAATPEGSVSAGGALIGAFSLSVTASRKPLRAALEAVRAWADAAARSAVVELDGDRLRIRGGDGTELDRAVAAFLDRHAADERPYAPETAP